MSDNEEKILVRLDKLEKRMAEMQENINALKGQPIRLQRQMSQQEVFEGLANLLTDDEAKVFGDVMDARASRKAAIYG